MKVLVTGATGFVGSHLTETLLEAEYEVRVLVRRPTQDYSLTWLGNDKARVIRGDIMDNSSVQRAVGGVDVVFHLAAQLGKWRVPEAEYHRINVYGTQVLLQECLKAGVEHFIYVSTAGVMGRLKQIPADEEHPCAPLFPYQRSKYEAELKIKEAVKKQDFPAIIIRPSHVYGPRDPNTIGLLKMIRRLKVFPLIGGGTSLFQPLYVTDLVETLLLCMKRSVNTAKKLYHIAGPQTITMREFICLSARIMGVRLWAVNIPQSFARAVASVSEGLGYIVHHEPPLTRSRVEFFGQNQTYSISRMQQDTGFVPQVGISEGLSRTIGWYRENGLL